MSKKQRPRRSNRSAVVEQSRPETQRAPRQPNIRPGATNFKPVSDLIVNQMYSNFGPQSDQSYMYSPGAPIKPVPGITPPTGPRVWSYPIGYNIAQLPRSTEQYSFADLRALATMYDGVQMCQQVWFDYVSRLELAIEPRPELLNEDLDLSIFKDDIQSYIEFFEYPDKEHNFFEWLCSGVHDQLEIDALAIYVRPDRVGRPFALDVLDGSTIKPLVDDRGRRPLPPWPAYEQFVYGVPACFLTSDNLIYVKETQRTDSVYGRSRVERIILRINQALRKETKDLARFTDGNIPAGIIEPSMDVNWSQEEIELYEMQFNNLMAGNDELRSRIKVLPRGFAYKPTDDPDIHIDLDQFVLTHTAACHGLTLDELAMTANSNRSVGQSQENVVYRRAMAPLMGRYAKLLTHILRYYFKEKRFIVKLRGYEEKEDFNTLSGAYATLTGAGIQSPTQAARAMHLPVFNDVEVPPFVLTKTGPIIVEDLADPEVRAAAKAAFIAGASAPQSGNMPQGGDEQEDEEDQENDNPAPTKGQQTGKKGAKNSQDNDEEAPTNRRIAEALDRVDESLRLLRAENVTPAAREWTREEVKRVLAPYLSRLDTSSAPDQQNTGMMLALMVNPKTAQALALPGGEPVNELHITLGYLGDMLDIPDDMSLRPHTSPDKIKAIVEAIASETQPLHGRIAGLGRFVQPAGERDVVIALPDIPGLPAFRQGIIEAVQSAGYFVADNHGYTPHISLIYVDKGTSMPVESVPSLPLDFYNVCLVIGDTVHSFPLGGTPDEATQPSTDMQDPARQGQSSTDRDTTKIIKRSPSNDLRIWKMRALTDIKSGHEIRPFISESIPPDLHHTLSQKLATALTPEDVRAVFERAKERDTSPKALAVSAVSGDGLDRSRSAWNLRW